MWISSDFLRLKEKARVSTGSRVPRSAGSVDTHFIPSATAPHPPTLCPRKSVIPRTKVNQSYAPSLPQEIRFTSSEQPEETQSKGLLSLCDQRGPHAHPRLQGGTWLYEHLPGIEEEP